LQKQKTVEKWRFAEVNYSSARNDFDGFYNASNYPNNQAFATLQADGSITAWLPHAVIEPSALRAAKACAAE
jgi:hypothetical protein